MEKKQYKIKRAEVLVSDLLAIEEGRWLGLPSEYQALTERLELVGNLCANYCEDAQDTPLRGVFQHLGEVAVKLRMDLTCAALYARTTERYKAAQKDIDKRIDVLYAAVNKAAELLAKADKGDCSHE